MRDFLKGLDLENLNQYQKNKRNWLLETDYNKKTITDYWKILNLSDINKLEIEKEKDLYSFSRIEIVELIKITPVGIRLSMIRIVEHYIDWMILRAYTNVNPCDCIIWDDIK